MGSHSAPVIPRRALESLRPVVVLLGVVALLAVVAAATVADRPRFAGSGSSDPTWVLDLGGSVVAIGAAVSLAMLAYAFWPGRSFRRKKSDETEVLEVPDRLPLDWVDRVVFALMLLVPLALLTGLVVIARDGGRSRAPTAAPTKPSIASPQGRVAPTRHGSRGTPDLDWWFIAGAVGTVGIIAGGALVAGRRPRDEPRAVEGAARGSLLGALDESLDALRGEPDERRAVIAAYARMELLLERVGVGRARWETPFEYLDRVLARLGAEARVAATLTELFEQAKFSRHRVTGAMKAAALDALLTLRDSVAKAA
jgi:hypothetical protein